MAINDIPDKIPYVGVGCIVIRDGQLLLVQNQRGFWSTPGGHLDFGESPDVCAARETLEETGISVANVEFVAITNDVLADAGRHYLTVWMRGDADSAPARIGDAAEINQLGWFAPGNLPRPCTSTFKICLKVVVGLDHLQTCHSQFHQSPNKTTQPTAGRVYRYAYFYVEPVFLGRNIFLAFRAGLQLVRIAA